MSIVREKSLGQMQDNDRKNSISVINIIRKERVKGWISKPKGVMQVLWKCVFLDTSNYVCTYYTLRGQQDDYGNTILENILRGLMLKCLDFIEQETLLQTNSRKMVERRDYIIIYRTPNFHPEISGEGIEYSWVYEKNY